MARSYMVVPWDSEFPKVCTSCTEPATRTIGYKIQKPSSQKWFFWFGIIGSAIASARKGNTLRFEVPYCDNCFQRDRNLLWAVWGSILLGLLLIFGSPFLFSLAKQSNNILNVLGVFGLGLGILLLVIVAPVLMIVRNRKRAIKILMTAINEITESITLTLRNLAYKEIFLQQNLERIVTWELNHDNILRLVYRKDHKLSVPLDQAIPMVEKRIDQQYPRSPQSLRGYFEASQLYILAERYEQAITYLDWVIATPGLENPYFLEAQYFRGQAFMLTGRNQQAQTDLGNYLNAASNKARIKKAKQWLKQLQRS